MPRRSRRLITSLTLVVARAAGGDRRENAVQIVQRSLLVVLALGGLALFAGSASAASLRWSQRRQVDIAGNISLGAMVCPAKSYCDALDADGRLVQFQSGPNQGAPNDIDMNDISVALDRPSPLAAMACPKGNCTVLDRDGNAATFAIRGNVYSDFRFIRVDRALSGATAGQSPPALACPSRTLCVVADGAGGVVSFAPGDPSAARRTVLNRGDDPGLITVACPSATQCTAISQTQEWTFNPSDPAAASTVTIDTSPGTATALACPSTRLCTSVDASGRETTFDPQTPSADTPAAVSSDPHADLTAVICTTATLCTAADHNGYLESFDPRSGALISRVPATDVNDLACLTATYCLADQSTGAVLPFTPGSSQDFSAQGTGLDNGSPLVDVSCPEADRCVAADPSYEVVFDTHSKTTDYRLEVPLPEDAHAPITGITCPLLTLCSVIRGDEQVALDPTRFRHPHPLVVDDDGAATFTAVRCRGAGECVAIDSDGMAVSYDPATGHVDRRIDVQKGRTLTALACPTRTRCTATDNEGTAISFDPLTGDRLLTVKIDAKVGLDTPGSDTGHELDGIACAATQSCVAVDTLGDEVSFDPRSRQGAGLRKVDAVTGLTAVACPSEGRCVLTGADGRVFTGRPNQPHWTAKRLYEATALTAVTCRSATECIATDDAGDEYTSR